MKRLSLLIIGVFLSLNIMAQSAKELLNSVVEKTKAYDDISIIFNYQIINNAAGIYENMNGYGSMKGASYLINVSGQELICNGELLWTFLIDDEEVMISEVSEDSNSSPIAIINSFSENVKVDFVEDNEPDITTLEIRENEGSTFERIKISIDNDLKIKKVHVFGTDDSEYIYEITDFKTNQNLPDEMFIFNEALYPNVEVIDMR